MIDSVCALARKGERDMQEQSAAPAAEDCLVLETAMEAGHILLENGAEIFRVEETMERISSRFGVEQRDFFVLSNGIFTTGSDNHHKGGAYARVQHIPVKGARLDKVVAVNQLSRDIEAGKCDLYQARERLADIHAMPEKKPLHRVLACGTGAGCFCYLFGGGVLDSLAAFFVGILLQLALLGAARTKMSRIVVNICAGGFVTLLCLLLCRAGLGSSLSHMIIGSIIPLVPGVPFTNGIRDIGDADYIAGSVRLLDAIITFVCVAVGVGAVFTIYHRLFGGAFL